ncbi:MAG TPA: hypothetical protein VGC42_21340 [Kofleriaceae bacterium]
MTKPTPPRLAMNEIVEIDALDVMEWQHGQRTPQASDANLAALVKQSARVHESAPIAVASPRTPSLVPRARPSEARPAMRAMGTGAGTPEPRPGTVPPARAGTAPPARTGTRAESPFPVIGTPPPPSDAGQPLPMAVAGYPIYRGSDGDRPVIPPPPTTAQSPVATPAPTAQTAAPVAPSGLPALYVPDRSDTPAAPLPVVKPLPAEPAPGVEARPRSRKLWWLAGAGGVAAAVLGVALAMATEAPKPPVATEPAAPAPAPAAASEPAAAPAPAAAPDAPLAESKPSVAAIVAHAAEPAPAARSAEPAPVQAPAPASHPAASHAPAPARVAAAIPGPSRPGPGRSARPGRKPKMIVVDYQTRADEAPVPGLVAQASEDPAIARARVAYLSGNDKLFAGDPSGAAAAYREALALYPGYVGGYRGLGLAYAQLGEPRRSLDALRAYVAAAPGAKDVALVKQRISRLQGK